VKSRPKVALAIITAIILAFLDRQLYVWAVDRFEPRWVQSGELTTWWLLTATFFLASSDDHCSVRLHPQIPATSRLCTGFYKTLDRPFDPVFAHRYGHDFEH
jgi:hypothetical protein